MIAHRLITGDDLLRAMQVNDAILEERGGEQVMSDLGVEMGSIMQHAQLYAEARDATEESVMLGFAMGALAGLRTVKILAHE